MKGLSKNNRTRVEIDAEEIPAPPAPPQWPDVTDITIPAGTEVRLMFPGCHNTGWPVPTDESCSPAFMFSAKDEPLRLFISTAPSYRGVTVELDRDTTRYPYDATYSEAAGWISNEDESLDVVDVNGCTIARHRHWRSVGYTALRS